MINNEKIDSKNLLLFLESKNLLNILPSLRKQTENAIHRVENHSTIKSTTGRPINPMLPHGGGRGYGLMPHDMCSLISIRNVLDEAARASEKCEAKANGGDAAQAPTEMRHTVQLCQYPDTVHGQFLGHAEMQRQVLDTISA